MKSTLLLIFALGLGLGCAATSERADVQPASEETQLPAANAPETALVGAEWSVEVVADMVMLNEHQPIIVFAKDGNITGNASCNSFFGTYEATGASLKITIGGMTRMACADPVDKQEQLFMTTLRQVDLYEIAGDSLTLWSGESVVITANLKQ